ncbi:MULTISPECIES: hypothetical protein [Actinomadura]|uniref:Neocarzinostatin family protein n=1 Tax=Actinomadura yumaensis TaxID=111807 RepID=A0ABW2CHY3_9ACTN|nr:hypothetical protein [Actinomadura sp. J1-007]MWK33079.1 hypothetical protein [Actinomadura sp. J1-007]
MVRTRQALTLGAAALAAVALAATPASAAGTVIHKGGPTGDPYTGKVRASLLGTASVTTSLGSGTCNRSTMDGSVNSDGTGLTITSASFTNDPGPACPGGGGTVAVTTEALPWSGGSVAYDSSHTGDRDAAVTIAGFKVKAVASVLGGITCYYGGSLTASGYNPDNPNRPDPKVAEAQVKVDGAKVAKQSGSNFLCPGDATVTSAYRLQGETSPGTFGQTLYITG